MTADLWDLTACCKYWQTGACWHTESMYDDDAEPLAPNRTDELDTPTSPRDLEEPF